MALRVNEYYFDFGLILAIASGLILLLWILLKISGIINTPLLISYLPLTTGVGAILGFGIAIGKVLQTQKYMHSDINLMKRDVQRLDKQFILLRAELKHHIRYR